MRVFVAIVFVLVAPFARAESLTADEFFARCVGPDATLLATAAIAGMSCQRTESCDDIADIDTRVFVMTDCFRVSRRLCFVSQDKAACFAALTTTIDDLVAKVLRDYPAERVDAAAQKKTTFRLNDTRAKIAAGVPSLPCDVMLGQGIADAVDLTFEEYCPHSDAYSRFADAVHLARRVDQTEAEAP